MDRATVAIYDKGAEARAALYGSDLSSGAKLVLRYLDPGACVLDIGSGTGRDVAALGGHGYDAYGIEPSVGMRHMAQERFGLGPDRIAEGGLPELGAAARGLVGSGLFDAVILSAVLQHICDRELFDSLFAIHELARPGAWIFLSHPLSYPGIGGEPPRDEPGRLFIMRPGDLYAFQLSRMGWACIARWEREDGLGRPGIRWELMAFKEGKP